MSLTLSLSKSHAPSPAPNSTHASNATRSRTAVQMLCRRVAAIKMVKRHLAYWQTRQINAETPAAPLRVVQRFAPEEQGCPG